MRVQLGIYTKNDIWNFSPEKKIKIAQEFKRVQFERIFKYHE